MACSPLWVFDSKIKQLEDTLKCFLEAVVVASLERSRRALELATNVTELFVDGEGEPAVVFESFMYERFHWMSESTISMISCRASSSSTPRERLPMRGLMLIIESNSTTQTSASRDRR